MRRAVGYALAALSVFLLIVGVSLGGMDVVWLKASRICLECVGLG
ncbi:MAG: CD1871A family CXXC motif-containing protein [Sphaerochaetaceae bacterium]|jgi:hypothetical protein